TALVGVGFMAMRRLQINWIREHPTQYASDASFYLGGYDLAGIALLIGLAVTISGLAVGTVESVLTRRRTLAALSATGTTSRVLGRAVLLETALPLVPAIVLASGCSLAMVFGALRIVADREPLPLLEPLLTAAGLLAAALLATAASLPLLRRTVHPAELRYE
ncbi:MAG: hypothetical protein QOF44_273, partial [Streptomyces sp.]|nr:hypothetical protein [Streptomyces sp.]